MASTLGANAARDMGTFAGKTKGQNPQIRRRLGTEWKNTSDIWNMDK
jgi:hypothetical protein